MRRLAPILLAALALCAAVWAAGSRPKPVKLDGQMICLWCDVVLRAEPAKKSEPPLHSGVFRSTDGTIYTILPDKTGRELLAVDMHEQKVAIEGYLMPRSQIIRVTAYKYLELVTPVTPEEDDPWLD